MLNSSAGSRLLFHKAERRKTFPYAQLKAPDTKKPHLLRSVPASNPTHACHCHLKASAQWEARNDPTDLSLSS